MIKRIPDGYQFGDSIVTVGRLSPREAQLLVLAANGLSSVEFSEVLGITRNSCYRLSQKLYWKLGVTHMVAALAEGRRRGYLRYQPIDREF